jgi:hypothetical protein
MKNPAALFTKPLQESLSFEEIIPAVGHNAFTDCQVWKGQLWLAFRAAHRHLAGHLADRKSRIVIMHSSDGKIWKRAAELPGDGWDIRDPKFFVIDDRIILYALLNRTLDPKPFKTVFTVSSDGHAWAEWKDAAPGGRLVGKPITVAGFGHYAPAHDIKLKNVLLMKLSDALFWEPGQIISSGGDETAILALPGGGLTAVIRMEEKRATGFTSAANPDASWAEIVVDSTVRLDGPCLFLANSSLYAVGRRLAPEYPQWMSTGSIFGRMRTALFAVSPGELKHLFDFPSSGDTGYAGTAQFLGKRFITYYSSSLNHDGFWLQGMLKSCGIHMAVLTDDLLGTLEISIKEQA